MFMPYDFKRNPMTASVIRSIKLTSHINPRLGYDAHPRFDQEVWSLLLAHAAEVEGVFLFTNSFWNNGARIFEKEEHLTPRISRAGHFERMTDRQFHELRRLTNSDNHLCVLYRARASSDLLPRLVNLFPRERSVGDEARDELGLKQDETNELRLFVQTHSPEHAIISFASNADPCYIFSSSPDALSLVLDRAALIAAPSLW